MGKNGDGHSPSHRVGRLLLSCLSFSVRLILECTLGALRGARQTDLGSVAKGIHRCCFAPFQTAAQIVHVWRSGLETINGFLFHLLESTSQSWITTPVVAILAHLSPFSEGATVEVRDPWTAGVARAEELLFSLLTSLSDHQCDQGRLILPGTTLLLAGLARLPRYASTAAAPCCKSIFSILCLFGNFVYTVDHLTAALLNSISFVVVFVEVVVLPVLWADVFTALRYFVQAGLTLGGILYTTAQTLEAGTELCVDAA
uniref:Uncharacterized protein n=1 Tax=Chromera velia CCMP2878 TaxID=1169474 RepID=A0A0G4HV81_9ALVE|eukprot:Cvel_32160.t1-p1 / transcript=Cvel_32160.t1 / gene=Cvel_32160 / organism=Chromera_velia_CCMP2878 / gene_product=hypothetical protein / transcript_product=hypothetical protein / location=Cvel_scaffold4938:6185-6955(+) / protein_length=257 / sequence_SO=supercontig / SO=protein_coding / is_pseudo=false